jgi:hypothetical protein
VKLADGTWRVFAVAQSLWNVPGWGSTGAAESTGVPPGGGSGGFIDPTTGIAFIDPSGGGEPVEVCGYGTTYSLVTPRMAWVEEVIADDVTPCFTSEGRWDPGDACTPFPMQIDQAVGTWAEGCAGAVGGEPQCGELEGGTASTSGGPAESSSGPEPGSDTSAGTSTGGDGNPSTGTNPSSSSSAPPTTSNGDDGSDTDDPGAAPADEGCGCTQEPRLGGDGLAFAVLLLVASTRRRRAWHPAPP